METSQKPKTSQRQTTILTLLEAANYYCQTEERREYKNALIDLMTQVERENGVAMPLGAPVAGTGWDCGARCPRCNAEMPYAPVGNPCSECAPVLQEESERGDDNCRDEHGRLVCSHEECWQAAWEEKYGD